VVLELLLLLLLHCFQGALWGVTAAAGRVPPELGPAPAPATAIRQQQQLEELATLVAAAAAAAADEKGQQH
jgi:Na+-transporting methylmalonyl-CoA/oxaloacetate decarboxylase gamma subunit